MKKLTLLLSSIIIAVGLSYTLYADNLNDIIKGVAYSCGTNPTAVKWCWVSSQQPLPVTATIANFFSPASNPFAFTLTEGQSRLNSSTTSAVNTSIVITLSSSGTRSNQIFSLDGYCSAGTSSLIIKDGATTIWITQTTEITTAHNYWSWPVPLTSTAGNSMTITMASCGAGNTGTLNVQASRNS